MTRTGICGPCNAPVPLDGRGLIAAHRQQILGAHGYVDGYLMCHGKGTRPKPQPEGN